MAAIYMWFDNEQMVLTTTLYPIEALDSVEFTCDIAGGDFRAVEFEEYDVSSDVLGASLEQILYTYGPDNEEYDVSSTIIGALLEKRLFTYGPDNEEYDVSSDVIGATLLSKLVPADTPDELLQFACDVNPPGCSLTPV